MTLDVLLFLTGSALGFVAIVGAGAIFNLEGDKIMTRYTVEEQPDGSWTVLRDGAAQHAHARKAGGNWSRLRVFDDGSVEVKQAEACCSHSKLTAVGHRWTWSGSSGATA